MAAAALCDNLERRAKGLWLAGIIVVRYSNYLKMCILRVGASP